MRPSFSFVLSGGVTLAALLFGMTASAASVGSSLGEYSSVACNTNSAFAAQSCNECFVGGKVKTGERLTGLFDTWTNNNLTPQVMYKDEQEMPSIVNLGAGGTSWTSTPTDNAKVWRYTTEVVWSPATSSGSRSQFLMMPNDKVKFLEADIGAGYNLVKSDKKDGDVIGLVKFPITYRNIDDAGNESEKQTHYECVTYMASAPVVAPPVTPPPVTPPTPTPAQVTTPKTGPETLLLIAAAFFIAFGLMFSLRKNS